MQHHGHDVQTLYLDVPGQARDAFFVKFAHLQGKRNLLYLSRLHPKKGCDLCRAERFLIDWLPVASRIVPGQLARKAIAWC